MDFSKIVISQKDQPGPSELTKDIHGKTIGNKAKTSGRQSRQFLHDTQSSSGTVGSGETDATEVQDGSTNSGISHGLHLLTSEEMRTLTSDSLNNEPLSSAWCDNISSSPNEDDQIRDDVGITEGLPPLADEDLAFYDISLMWTAATD